MTVTLLFINIINETTVSFKYIQLLLIFDILKQYTHLSLPVVTAHLSLPVVTTHLSLGKETAPVPVA